MLPLLALTYRIQAIQTGFKVCIFNVQVRECVLAQTSQPPSLRPSAMRDTPVVRSVSAAASQPLTDGLLAPDAPRESTAGQPDSDAQPAPGPSQVCSSSSGSMCAFVCVYGGSFGSQEYLRWGTLCLLVACMRTILTTT